MVRSSLRWLAIGVVACALLWLCMHHEDGGMKGLYVPIPNLISCILFAASAAVLVKRFWHAFPAPFVAGIAGSFGIAGAFFGPFGGIIGLLVGTLIALLPFADW